MWDARRIARERRLELAARGVRKLAAVAQHVASGRLVAFTELLLSPDAPRQAWQLVTLVHPEHRGHRLGLAVKLANLEVLAARRALGARDRHRQRGGERADDRRQRHDGLRDRRRRQVLAEGRAGRLTVAADRRGPPEPTVSHEYADICILMR